MEFKIRIQNEIFIIKIKNLHTQTPSNLEFKVVISDILLRFFLLSTYAHDDKVQC